jgi:hypothetical protein
VDRWRADAAERKAQAERAKQADARRDGRPSRRRRPRATPDYKAWFDTKFDERLAADLAVDDINNPFAQISGIALGEARKFARGDRRLWAQCRRTTSIAEAAGGLIFRWVDIIDVSVGGFGSFSCRTRTVGIHPERVIAIHQESSSGSCTLGVLAAVNAAATRSDQGIAMLQTSMAAVRGATASLHRY